MAEHKKINKEKNTYDKHTKVRAGEKGKDKPNFTVNPNKRRLRNTSIAIASVLCGYAAINYKTIESIINNFIF